MTPIEIIVLLFIAISVIKLVTLAIRPASWYGKGNPLMTIFSGRVGATVASLTLGGVILAYLLREISIVQIFAAMIFGWILILFTMAPFVDRLFEWVGGLANDPRFFLKNIPSIAVWVVLMAWVLKEIFY